MKTILRCSYISNVVFMSFKNKVSISAYPHSVEKEKKRKCENEGSKSNFAKLLKFVSQNQVSERSPLMLTVSNSLTFQGGKLTQIGQMVVV